MPALAAFRLQHPEWEVSEPIIFARTKLQVKFSLRAEFVSRPDIFAGMAVIPPEAADDVALFLSNFIRGKNLKAYLIIRTEPRTDLAYWISPQDYRQFYESSR